LDTKEACVVLLPPGALYLRSAWSSANRCCPGGFWTSWVGDTLGEELGIGFGILE